jgi:hypothetical protein
MLLAAPAVAAAPTWNQTDVYDLRLEGVARCTSKTGVKIGVKVKVRSKTKSLFVAPRDATLYDGGVLFKAITDDTKLAGCRPVFKPTSLRNRAETSGYLVFEVPAKTGKLVFEFSPTRWGGSTPVRTELPALR